MKPEIRKLWVEALRSGKYTQTTGDMYRIIHEKPCFCVLGVLCDLYRKDKGLTEQVWRKDFMLVSLPSGVREWAGMTSSVGMYFDKLGIRTTLMEDNDTLGKSYEELADIIETSEIL